MTDNNKPLWQWSACDIAEAVAGRKVTPSEAVGSAVERMRETNGHLNAVVDDLSEVALRRAEAMDKAIAAGEPVGPLAGVPTTIKENIDQKGYATPNGVTAYKDVMAPDDSPVVRNLESAGAIVIGRTNTPEFSFRGTTVNALHGRTYNPWNDTASAGGSSGGAASAVMAGIGAIAHGNDIGGSLRFPAYACAAATVKPGLGRVPAYNPSAAAERGMLAQVSSVQGAICREVRDVRLAMRTLVNYDPRDPWQVPMPFDVGSDGPVKVAFTRNTFDFDLHPAVDKALETAKAALTDADYQVEEVEPPLLREAAVSGFRTLFGEVKALMDADIRKHGSNTLVSIFDAYYRYFEPFEGNDLLLAYADRNRFLRAWTTFLADYPLVLTPFLPNPIFEWNRDEQGEEGVREVLGSAYYSIAMNYMGLPAGIVQANENDGQPVGVQIVGRRFREDQILDACEAVEKSVGVMAQKLWARG
ncbi:MAG: amidase family protein [Alphaproteobacteria bacterium]